jgi:hypothetical protein
MEELEVVLTLHGPDKKYMLLNKSNPMSKKRVEGREVDRVTNL